MSGDAEETGGRGGGGEGPGVIGFVGPGPGDARGPAPVLKRLVVALVLCIILAVACWVLAPRLGVAIPPLAPLIGFAVIAAGTLLGVWESRKPPAGPAGGDDQTGA